MKHVVVDHPGSIEVPKGADQNIHFANMVNMMMDYCSVMRGTKSCLEARIREKHCQNLLDVDGDSCHHVHNASKQFAAPLRYYLEQLFTDLHMSPVCFRPGKYHTVKYANM